ncbi:hypothetical protein LTR01_003386 [Friedmanniomyces endolithicus]|nr:hypothetical protein LTR01_003386 [Friedmanniomyces endolithicus]
MRSIGTDILFQLAGHGHQDVPVDKDITDPTEGGIGDFQDEDLLAHVSDQGVQRPYVDPWARDGDERGVAVFWYQVTVFG